MCNHLYHSEFSFNSHKTLSSIILTCVTVSLTPESSHRFHTTVYLKESEFATTPLDLACSWDV